MFAISDLAQRPDIVEVILKAKQNSTDKKYCHDCVHCDYYDSNELMIALHFCDKHEEMDDIRYDTEAFDDFKERKKW